MGNGKAKKEIIQSVVEPEVLTFKKHPKRYLDAFLKF